MTYTYNEAFEASKKYFEGDELAARVWATKYALKDSQGNYFELLPTICTAELLVRLLVLRENIKTQWMSNCCST